MHSSRSSFGEELEPLDQIQQLERILHVRESRNELIDELLITHSTDVIRVRFLCAVYEILRTTDKQKQRAKARKLVQAFVARGGKYYLDNIPPGCRSDLLHLRQRGFEQVRNIISRELCRNPIIRRFVENEAVTLSFLND